MFLPWLSWAGGRKPLLHMGNDFRLSCPAQKLIALSPRWGALSFLEKLLGSLLGALVE